MDVKVFKVFRDKSFIKKEGFSFFWDVVPDRQELEERRRLFFEWIEEVRERAAERLRQE